MQRLATRRAAPVRNDQILSSILFPDGKRTPPASSMRQTPLRAASTQVLLRMLRLSFLQNRDFFDHRSISTAPTQTVLPRARRSPPISFR